MAKLLMIHRPDNGRDDIARLLATNPEWEIAELTDTDDVVEAAKGFDLALVDLSDRQPEESNLVSDLRQQAPHLPILIIAPDDDHDALVKALVLGVASYVPHGRLASELVATIERLLALCGREHRRRVAECLRFSQLRLVVSTDRKMVPVVVGHLQDCAKDFGLVNDHDCFRLGVALDEALVNALVHGNLEVSSERRGIDDEGYAAQIQQRQQEKPYSDRVIAIEATFDDEQATIVIADEGPGFNPGAVPDPTAPENLLKAHGRGLMLMRTFLDEVSYNEKGNVVTMVKRRSAE